MTRTSLIALIAALGLAVPSLARADCHLPADTERPTASDAAEDPAVLAEDSGAGDEARELRIGDSAILPSAGGHLESEAPTMAIDCQANPEFCTGEPIETPVEGPALSTADNPDTAAVESRAGTPVIAEATDC